MKLKYSLIIFLSLLAIIFISYGNLSSAKNLNQSEVIENEDIINKIIEEIHEKELSIQIEEKLKKNGYSTSGLILYQIYSPDEQYVTISMENIDLKNKNVKQDIQKIVDIVSKENNFNLFEVDLQQAN